MEEFYIPRITNGKYTGFPGKFASFAHYKKKVFRVEDNARIFHPFSIKNFLPKYLHDALGEVEVNEYIGICREFRLKYSKPDLRRGKTAD